VNNILEQNKQMALYLHREIWSNGNLDLCDDVYAQDFVCHFLVGPEWHGPEDVKDHIKALRGAFSDWREEVEDIIAEGDHVVTRFTSHGTHRGTFQGIGATGKAVVVREVAIFRFENGKIVEQWGFPDIAGLRKQLLEPTEPGLAELAHKWFRGLYGADLLVMDELAAEEVALSYPVFQKLFDTPVIRGREQVKAFARRFVTKWAEPEMVIHETIEQGNQVVLVWSFKARNVAPLSEGVEASNEVHSWGGISLIRFNDDGKVTAEIGEEGTPGPIARLAETDR
jgi:steroid delta-isomerase-like uncharacterized protein